MHQRRAVAAADRNAKQFPTPVTGLTLARTRSNLGDLLWVAGDLNGWWDAFQTGGMTGKARAEALNDPVRIEQMQIAYRRAGDILGNPSFFHMGETAKADVYHRKALELGGTIGGKRSGQYASAEASLRSIAQACRGTPRNQTRRVGSVV